MMIEFRFTEFNEASLVIDALRTESRAQASIGRLVNADHHNAEAARAGALADRLWEDMLDRLSNPIRTMLADDLGEFPIETGEDDDGAYVATDIEDEDDYGVAASALGRELLANDQGVLPSRLDEDRRD